MEMNKTHKTLVYVQLIGGEIAPVSYELIAQAHRLYPLGEVVALVVGDVTLMAEKIAALPVEKVISFQPELLYTIGEYAAAFVQCAKEEQPDVILVGATREGRALAPYVAAQLEAGLTADCTQLQLDEDGRLLQIRPAFGQSVMATIVSRGLPQMATVRPGMLVMEDIVSEKVKKQRVLQYKTGKSLGESISFSPQVESQSIAKAPFLVVLGGGVPNMEVAQIFMDWAERMGGTYGHSRKLVERGWFDATRQIGLSGSASQATLMMTIGVSGSVQFQAGIGGVERLIAVNNDPQAPIFKRAHQGIVADLEQLAQRIREIDR